MPMILRLMLALCLGVLALAPSAAQAQTCTVIPVGPIFGIYSSTSVLTTVGSIGVTCLSVTGGSASYTIALSAGSGSIASRHFNHAAPYFYYQMYSDAARTQVWGDGTAGSVVVSDSDTLLPAIPVVKSYTIYASIASGQYVAAAVYTDTITVTVTY